MFQRSLRAGNTNQSDDMCFGSTIAGGNVAACVGAKAKISASGAATFTTLTLGSSSVLPILSGTTGSIGGSLLAPGACVAGTATVTGATTSMATAASPSSDPDSTLSTGIAIYSFVSASNTATVRVCALVSVTPAATTYNVRVIQ